MLMPLGIVKEVKDKTVVVTLERQDMCGDCHACEMISGKKACTLTCESKIPCQVGDQVEIELTTDYFLKATYLIYGVPLLGLVVGLIIGIGITKIMIVPLEDLVMAACMLIGTGLGIIYIKVKDKKKSYHKFLPHVVEKKNV